MKCTTASLSSANAIAQKLAFVEDVAAAATRAESAHGGKTIAAECDSLEAALACRALRRTAAAGPGGCRLFLPLRVGFSLCRTDLACFCAACLLPRGDSRWWSFGLQIPDGTRLLGTTVLGAWSVDPRTGLLRLEEDMSSVPQRWWELAQRENPPELWRRLSEMARTELGAAITTTTARAPSSAGSA